MMSFVPGILVLLLPTYLVRFSIVGIPFTLLEIFVLAVIGVWVARGGIKKIITERSYRVWLILGVAWMVIGTIEMLMSPSLRSAAGVWKAYIIEPTILFFVFLDVLRDVRARKYVWYGCAVLSIALGAFLLVQHFTGWGIVAPWDHLVPRRATGLFGYPNANGLLLAPLGIMLLGLSLFEKMLTRRERVAMIIGAVFAFVGIYCARSVGAFVGVVAGVFVLLFFSRAWQWLTWLFALVGIIILSLLPKFQNELFMRDWSGQVRLGQWQETWNMLKDHWIFGAGLAGYQHIMPAYHTRTYIEIFMYPHNLFLNVWSEIGLLGLVLFLSIIIFVFYIFFKNQKRNRKLPITSYQLPMLAAFVTLLVHGLVDVPYFKNDLSILFWLVVALMVVKTEVHKGSVFCGTGKDGV